MYNEQLAKETLTEAGGYIKKVLVVIDEVLDNFLTGREDLALKDFPNVVDGFEWLLNVISLTEPTQKVLAVEFEDVPKFIDVINEMVAALENNDFVLLGDLLTYEAKPVIEKWDNQFRIIGERLNLS